MPLSSPAASRRKMAASILMRPVNQWVVVRDSLEEPNFKHVNSGGPPVNGFACLRRRFGSAQNRVCLLEKAIRFGAELQFLQGISAVPRWLLILCSGNRLSGHRVQPSGLRPVPAFSGVELSHSLVNMTQWLTARTCGCAKITENAESG